METHDVGVRPGTRNHKGYFVQHASGYKLVEIADSGWAVICLSDAVCHYVDPENLQMSRKKDFGTFSEI
ncbi:hypothetical protein [Myxacorys almedinensis]|uniref:Uncharacterized protein n=1 Tax=Myxacorys almedinensis A TaxID=2690445 RepID=A0A8J7Z484_9CYAN|nr:hypothetical protein [Myxacorys almedinensis]NDJ17828.1 hypothetical protein [Myxacorys almedinensis A]